METRVHPSAVVDPSAQLGEGVTVGPFAVIGPDVVIGDGCEVGAGAKIEGPTVLGRENRIFSHACIGFEPQDLKFAGEETRLEVGDRNHFREFCTVHRGTGKGGGLTKIGDDSLFMAYTHVAHDCIVGSRVVFANAATLAGHVEVGDDATISAFSSIHQFCRVGRHAYVGGYSVITQDALPFVKTVGAKPACYGLNRIGLERKGFDRETLTELEAAYRLLVRGSRNLASALDALAQLTAPNPAVVDLIEFAESSERGLIRHPPGRKGGQRGG